MTYKNIIKITQILLILLVSMAVVNSATGLNLILSSQTPDPVTPGNFVYLNVKVSNTGSGAINGMTLEIEDNDYFSIAQSSDKIKSLGIIPAYSTTASTGFVIVKYKVLVAENTPQGLNTISFIARSTSGVEFSYDLEVLVQDDNPTISVKSINIDDIEPGKSTPLEIEIENSNSIQLKNIVVKLGLDSVDSKVLTVERGSNEKRINSMNAFEKQKIKFNLVASPDALAKPYLLPITITAKDSLGNNLTSEILGSVRVYSKPILSLNLDSQDSFSIGKKKVTLAIANPGTSTIKGTRIEFLDSQNYNVLSGNFQYVGDLNPDDFQTIQSEIFTNNIDAILKVKVIFLDSYNNENTKIYDINLKGFTSEQLKSFGNQTTNSKSKTSTYVIFLILLIATYFVGRRLGFKKGKRN